MIINTLHTTCVDHCQTFRYCVVLNYSFPVEMHKLQINSMMFECKKYILKTHHLSMIDKPFTSEHFYIVLNQNIN